MLQALPSCWYTSTSSLTTLQVYADCLLMILKSIAIHGTHDLRNDGHQFSERSEMWQLHISSNEYRLFICFFIEILAKNECCSIISVRRCNMAFCNQNLSCTHCSGISAKAFKAANYILKGLRYKYIGHFRESQTPYYRPLSNNAYQHGPTTLFPTSKTFSKNFNQPSFLQTSAGP